MTCRDDKVAIAGLCDILTLRMSREGEIVDRMVIKLAEPTTTHTNPIVKVHTDRINPLATKLFLRICRVRQISFFSLSLSLAPLDPFSRKFMQTGRNRIINC